MTTENAPVTPHAFQLVPENKAGSAYIFCPNCGATRWLRAAGEPVNEPCRPASPATGEGLWIEEVDRLRAIEAAAAQIVRGTDDRNWTGRDAAVRRLRALDPADRHRADSLARLAATTPDPAEAASPDALDVAWQEAEAALPEGWRIWSLSHAASGVDDDEPWMAVAGQIENIATQHFLGLAHGPTPAAALRALAAKLREAGE